MAEADYHRCLSCPAYYQLTGEGGAGVCRARPPVVFQDRDYFRGSTRSMLFGAYPAVGTFPLVKRDDFCMEHPGNRELWAKPVDASVEEAMDAAFPAAGAETEEAADS
jgi:hypothetical protein